ncbi:thiamine-monophosphate kinase [Phycicoccus sp. Root563]|uniref:thiamine-phosphate kinase n=1 Tax=Phycicoccus sp. Root563 TaxID=1736562 RepID=UPI0007025BD7|nr:thiamine-phosphate kinase [Phycicoccus sp. Root563]KQZ88924.1 thiamine-monophosphate kinase [Phycicoccus sp. Root563]
MVTAGRTLAQVSEASLLAEIFPFFPAREGVLVGPGDDAAVLASTGPVVVTTDAMVRGRDWLDEWSTAADVATKAFTQNVADVAAMGAVPTSLVVTLVADPATPADWAVEFARTLGGLADAAGVAVAGGDLSSAPAGTVMVSITALGDLQGRDPVLRSGARPGDTVAVHGSLGRSAAGLVLLQQGAAAHDETGGVRATCLAHHRRPLVELSAGPAAADAGATAMLDVSDGLLRDGSRIAAASGVRLALDSALLEPDLIVLREAVGEAALECVLAGGEEHSLLATFAGPLPGGWRPLGRVEEGEGVTLDRVSQQPRGWDHFAG